MKDIFLKINEAILEANSILIATHEKPDGDACGSALALALYLQSLGKNFQIFANDKAPDFLFFMPLIDRMTTSAEVFSKKWDLVICVDATSTSRAFLPDDFVSHSLIINFDHHITNDNFGKHNVMDAAASSTAEIFFNFFKAIDFPIDRRLASCLLTGILTDTGGFSHPNTSTKTMAIASELMKKGTKIHQIFNHVVHNKSLGGLRLWGMVLSRIQTNQKLDLAYTYVTADDLINYQVPEEEIDGLVNFLNVISDYSVVMLFKIDKGFTKASIRTKRDDIDVSRLALAFGGGGHQKAAGFSLPWRLEELNGKLVVKD